MHVPCIKFICLSILGHPPARCEDSKNPNLWTLLVWDQWFCPLGGKSFRQSSIALWNRCSFFAGIAFWLWDMNRNKGSCTKVQSPVHVSGIRNLKARDQNYLVAVMFRKTKHINLLQATSKNVQHHYVVNEILPGKGHGYLAIMQVQATWNFHPLDRQFTD